MSARLCRLCGYWVATVGPLCEACADNNAPAEIGNEFVRTEVDEHDTIGDT